MSNRVITVRLPLADWYQIVSDIENMCGMSSEGIEILQNVTVVDIEDQEDS